MSLAGNRVGRAYIRPVYAQVNAPLENGRMSPLLNTSCRWFVEYLTARPFTWIMPKSNQDPIICWVDAASDPLYIGVVVYVDGKWLFTHGPMPKCLIHQCRKRGDKYIGLAETFSVSVAFATFKKDEKSCRDYIH